MTVPTAKSTISKELFTKKNLSGKLLDNKSTTLGHYILGIFTI